MKHILNNLTEEEKKSIREQHTGGIKIVNENFSKLINATLGDSKPLVEQQATPTSTTEPQKSIVTKVASEGIKNVTSEMISSPPFDGMYSGYQFGGVFNGTNYQWNCNGVEGMSGVRGMVDGQITSESVEVMIRDSGESITDAKPNSVSVGFYSNNVKFIIYTTTSNKPKCVNY